MCESSIFHKFFCIPFLELVGSLTLILQGKWGSCALPAKLITSYSSCTCFLNSCFCAVQHWDLLRAKMSSQVACVCPHRHILAFERGQESEMCLNLAISFDWGLETLSELPKPEVWASDTAEWGSMFLPPSISFHVGLTQDPQIYSTSQIDLSHM